MYFYLINNNKQFRCYLAYPIVFVKGPLISGSCSPWYGTVVPEQGCSCRSLVYRLPRQPKKFLTWDSSSDPLKASNSTIFLLPSWRAFLMVPVGILSQTAWKEEMRWVSTLKQRMSFKVTPCPQRPSPEREVH